MGHTSSLTEKKAYSVVETQLGRASWEVGPGVLNAYSRDPKHLGFQAARYKFVAKMLAECGCVLEIGCQEGFFTPIVAQNVERVIAIDFFKPSLEKAQRFIAPEFTKISFLGHDILDGPIPEHYEAAYAIDVLEHIDPQQEDLFLRNIIAGFLDFKQATLIIGIPSLNSQQHSSDYVRHQHINCKSADQLRLFLRKYFVNVFIFGMNDEVLHTGFFPLCNYLFALCVSARPLTSDESRVT